MSVGMANESPDLPRREESSSHSEALSAIQLRSLIESEEKYHSVFSSIDEGFCIIEVIQGENGAEDYRYLEVNPAFERHTGLANAAGKLVSEFSPGTESYWIDSYGDIVRTGERKRFESFHSSTGRWYDVFASRVGGVGSNRVGVVFSDITERKRVEIALREREADLARVQRIGRVGGLDIDIVGGMKGWRSPEYLRLHGLPQHTVRENHEQWRARVHPEDRERAERTLFNALNSKDTTYMCEYRIVRPSDGAVRWILARADIERDTVGRAIRMRGAHVDVTEQKQMQEALRESEERQAFLLKFSDVLRTQTDADSVSELATRLLSEHLGLDICQLTSIDVALDRATITHQYRQPNFPAVPLTLRLSDFPTPLGRMFDETVVVNDARNDRELSETDRRSLASINFGSFVASIVRRGESNPIWAMVAACRTARNWRPVEVALIEDIAERTWSALERIRAEQALRDADRRKDEFLAMLAHELRNPLAAIRNAGKIIARGTADARSIQSASDILDRQVANMVRQVDDLLDVSRITRNKIELRKEQTELVSIINLAIEGSRGLCERLGHELIVTLPDTPIFLDGDRIRLAQVVSNLLNNACKFTDRNGRIWIDLTQEGAEAVIRVRDTGIGLADNELVRIFEMFSQVDRSLERTRDGLGLGLSLVKSLVELHGGSVEATSDGLGRGSQFIVKLPCVSSSTAVADPEDLRVESTQLIARRVLVADDNRDSASSLAMLLRMMGHEVDIANDGIEAVERASAFHAEIVLLDIGMPGLNGYDAARLIREGQQSNLTLIAMTGWGQEEDRRRSKEAGFDAHLVKPVDLSALTKLIDESCQDKIADD